MTPDTATLQALDWLATHVALLSADARLVHANLALQDALSLSRRHLQGRALTEWLSTSDGELLLAALQDVQAERQDAVRLQADLLRPAQEPLAVHVVVTRTDWDGVSLVELLPLEAQQRQAREARLIDQAQANKALIRNLAHEIKNPLGGLRGAAQLLEMEIESALPDRALTEYTQVIIREADRLQTLVDRLLVPHRHKQQLGDVNIHEVCERVRALVLAEFPTGLTVQRDYDTSLPDLRGDREQLIQALLNIVHNAALALAERRATNDARITLRTRVARQVTVGGQRHKLALELHVIDNGPGVPASIQDSVFAPLVTARDGGTGLGLTLAQTFVQQHGGLIECDSEPGRTDFKLLIPL